jgi:hypothetical protein
LQIKVNHTDKAANILLRCWLFHVEDALIFFCIGLIPLQLMI